MALPVESPLPPSARDLTALAARLTRMSMMAEALVLTSTTLATITKPMLAMIYSAVASASVVFRNSAPSAIAVSDKATTSQTGSLMMADAATSVVLAVLLSEAASVDMVLMVVVMILSMTMAKSAESMQAVNSQWSSAMSVISEISVVHEVSQA